MIELLRTWPMWARDLAIFAGFGLLGALLCWLSDQPERRKRRAMNPPLRKTTYKENQTR